MSNSSDPSLTASPELRSPSPQSRPRTGLVSGLQYRLKALRKYYWGILVTTAAGVALVVMPLGEPLARMSYDLPFMFRTGVPQPNIVLVFAGQQTLSQLGRAEDGTLDRQAHVKLLDLLTAQRARMVIYDFLFNRSNRVNQVDEQLAGAIRRNGRVVLAAAYDLRLEGGRLMENLIMPFSTVRDAAFGWGLVEFDPIDPDNCVRSICTKIGYYPSAVWIAATNLSPGGPALRASGKAVKWLNYYGPPQGTVFEARMFHDVVQTNGIPPDFFRDKIVFVGGGESGQGRTAVGRSEVGPIGALKDEFHSPYSKFGFQDSPGLEIHATALANLTNGDWLTRMPAALQAAMTAIWGVVLSVSLLLLSRLRGIWLAVVAMLVIGSASISLQLHAHVWWSWLVPVVVQTPLALLCFVLANPLPTGPPVAFISYRRDKGAETARLIRLALRDRRRNVFLDVEDLGVGRFDEALLAQIARTPNFILILSPGALDRTPSDDDWVRKEIAHALKTGRQIVPLFKDKFVPPPHDSLPADISDLPFHNGVIYSHEQFDATIDRLMKFLK